MNRVELLEIVRERQIGTLSRRDFLLKSTAFLGSSTAAMTLLSACTSTDGDVAAPVVDQTANSSELGLSTSDGITSGIVAYPYQNDNLMGYLAYQSGDTPRPIVIVVQEWWGLNDHIKDIANRYAA